ncbi:MAG TPA: glycosyltransferase family 2 protein [Candidatus Limnocylindrales bacterium]|nr:glycosyltransferase family 2 protein [Candidatus Limnocylindrales bacterium]
MVVDLSIIILNYNTKQLTLDAIASIEKNYPEDVKSGNFEVIVADNASPDDSLKSFKDYANKTKIKTFLVEDNGGNIGFAKGNNNALKNAHGRYILFLNPDTIVYPNTLSRMIEFMDEHKDAGAATCKVVLPTGGIDDSSHRGFPTPWNALSHFSKLEKVFSKSKLFSGYIQGFKNINTIHEVDAISGAFLLVRRDVGEKIGWWDEEYFFYGEDLQFCYDIKKLGFKIYYIPDVSILHYGGVSSGIKKQSHHISTADKERRRIMQGHRFEAMRIFYKKNYSGKYPKIINWIVECGISFLHKRNTT